MTPFFKAEQHDWEFVSEGVKRKVVGLTSELMAVHLRFDKGAVGAVHSHEIHDQIGYVVQGKFEISVDGQKHILNKGDAYTAQKHFLHGAKALEQDSVLLDMFSPAREDVVV